MRIISRRRTEVSTVLKEDWEAAIKAANGDKRKAAMRLKPRYGSFQLFWPVEEDGDLVYIEFAEYETPALDSMARAQTIGVA